MYTIHGHNILINHELATFYLRAVRFELIQHQTKLEFKEICKILVVPMI